MALIGSRPMTTTSKTSRKMRKAPATAGTAPGCGLPVTPERSLIVPRLVKVDAPDPVAEEGPVKGKSTEGSDDEDRERRPYHFSHAFDGSSPNRHSVEVLMLWGHKAQLCLPTHASRVCQGISEQTVREHRRNRSPATDFTGSFLSEQRSGNQIAPVRV
jgi:hypothetical protein